MVPTLAFCDATSVISNDIVAFGDLIAENFPKMNAISSIAEGVFEHKVSFIQFEQLQVVCFSHNGVYVERETERQVEIVIPIEGDFFGKTDETIWQLSGGNNALLSIGEKITTSSIGSGVGFAFSERRLNATLTAIVGVDDLIAVNLETQKVPLEIKNVSFASLFKGLNLQIDAVGGDPVILQKLAIDDAFYRLFVGLLHPSIFKFDETHKGRRPQVRKELQDLCEWLRANLTKNISLTEMERRTGLSARVLQYSFERSFGLSPKRWLRKQRLHAARSVLLNPPEPLTLTALAYDFGFSSPSEFTLYYQKEFGENPSQTVKRLRRQIPL